MVSYNNKDSVSYVLILGNLVGGGPFLDSLSEDNEALSLLSIQAHVFDKMEMGLYSKGIFSNPLPITNFHNDSRLGIRTKIVLGIYLEKRRRINDGRKGDISGKRRIG